MARVLVTNGQLRKTLAVVRSLGAKGVYSIVSDETHFTPAGFSKYCSKRLVYPNPVREPEEFYGWLTRTLKKYECDQFFPMDDDTMDVAIRYQTELSEQVQILLPPFESYNKARDKGEALLVAQKAGASCPVTYFPDNLEEAANLAKDLKFPVIIKPRRSSGSRGIRVVNSPEELITQYTALQRNYPRPIIQEYLEQGTRFDVCLLYDSDNNLKASFVQKELRHFPLEMGPSTLQESVIYPELLEQALAIMKNLPWRGVVELEFMIDKRDGRVMFMEINPRFWNSLYLAVLAGVDFPWLLYQLGTDEQIEGEFVYQTGLKCQYLLPGDILHFLANKDRMSMNPPLWAGKKHQVYDDIISKEDIGPTFGFQMACLRYLTDAAKWRFLLKR